MKTLCYVLTLQWTNPLGGNSVFTDVGVLTEPKPTRQENLMDILRWATEKYKIPNDQYGILCFSLEPNDLA